MVEVQVSERSTATGRRSAWLAAGVLLIAAAVVEASRHHLGLWPIGFTLVPDLSFTAGIGQASEHGQLPRRAVGLYNLVHRPVLPLGLIVAGSVGALSLLSLVVGLCWLAHITVDRAMGYGLRTPEGWQRG